MVFVVENEIGWSHFPSGTSLHCNDIVVPENTWGTCPVRCDGRIVVLITSGRYQTKVIQLAEYLSNVMNVSYFCLYMTQVEMQIQDFQNYTNFQSYTTSNYSLRKKYETHRNSTKTCPALIGRSS